jgi:hypothetical protein
VLRAARPDLERAVRRSRYTACVRMRVGRLTSTLLASFVFWWTAGCSSKSCTEMGCIDGVEVRFTTALDAAQEISLVVQADAESISCTYSETPASDTCSPAGIWIQASGGSVTGFILYQSYPQELTITLSHGGTIPTSTTVSPKYVEQQPNGPDCPSTCQNAVVELE